MERTESKFVHPISQQDGTWEQELGITKKEYFAAKAMQAMISNPNIKRPEEGVNLQSDLDNFSRIAVEYSDSLIRALANER